MRKFERLLSIGSRAYLILLVLWLLARGLVGDRLLYMPLANAAIAYFIPLPLALITVWRERLAWLWALWLIGLLAFLSFWGGLFLPSVTLEPDSGERLRVMTYNVEGENGAAELAIDSLRKANADIVLLQEVTPGFASLLESELGEKYPWRWLDPRTGANGMGILSKVVFEQVDAGFSGRWNGQPQLIEFRWGGEQIRVLNVHLHASRPAAPAPYTLSVETRRANFAALELSIKDLLHSAPLIVAGDFNITHLNEGYAQMTKRLRDAWWEAGFGFGHTYPVDAQPPGLVAWKYGIPVPQRLIRIDYVFVSEEWVIASAQVLPNTGGSDHLGVMVDLGLAE